MRWIDRGPEPDGVQGYAQRFTQGWVEYFEDRIGERPNDSHWREFRELLGSRSGNVCWYCERRCLLDADDVGRAPTVDHFRPLSRHPELAYRWSNWIFSCRRCNGENKQDKWPASGYVDPSAADEQERPERYFDYDAETGEIIPMPGLSSEAHERALRTIDDLGLNRSDVRFYRLHWTRRFVEDWHALPNADRPAFAEFSTRSGFEFVGVTSMAVQQLSAQPGHGRQ